MKNQVNEYIRKTGVSIWVFTLIATLCVAFVPQVMAEESVIITLHEQIGREVEAMKLGFEQLGTETPAMAESREWVKRAKELPQDSAEFAHARAQFVAARSQDLEYIVMVAEQTYVSTASLTDTIDRLIAVQEKAAKGKTSLLGGESEEIIRQKAHELQGIDRMMTALIKSGIASKNPKVKMAQQAFQVKMKNTMKRVHSDNSTGIEKLVALRDTTEGLAFLMRAYVDGLDLQHMRLTTLAISGQADAVFTDASLVIGDALAMLNPDNIDYADEEYFMDTMNSDYSDVMGGSAYRESIANDIDAAAAYMIANQ